MKCSFQIYTLKHEQIEFLFYDGFGKRETTNNKSARMHLCNSPDVVSIYNDSNVNIAMEAREFFFLHFLYFLCLFASLQPFLKTIRKLQCLCYLKSKSEMLKCCFGMQMLKLKTVRCILRFTNVQKLKSHPTQLGFHLKNSSTQPIFSWLCKYYHVNVGRCIVCAWFY